MHPQHSGCNEPAAAMKQRGRATTLALVMILAITLAITFLAGPVQAKVVDRIVATVNGEVITLYDLNAKLRPMLAQLKRQGVPPQSEEGIARLRNQLLDNLIEEILIVQEAEHYKVTVSEVELDNYIGRIKKTNQLDEDKFTEYLKNQGVTREEFVDKVRKDMLKHRILSYMVKRKIVITDEDIKKYYDEHIDDFMGKRTVGLALIVLPPGEDATTLVQSIKSGDVTFADAAAKHSIGPEAENGGGIGTLEWANLAPEWKTALEGLGPGDVSEPFVLEGQQAVLQVNALSSGEARPIEEVSEEISDLIREPMLETRYEEYMAKLKEKAVIDIRL